MFYSQLGIDLAHKPTVKILFFAGNAHHIWILDFGKIAQLTCLKRLRLRAACGVLTVPSFTFSGGLMALGNLKDLTKLVKHDRVNLCRIHSVLYCWV